MIDIYFMVYSSFYNNVIHISFSKYIVTYLWNIQDESDEEETQARKRRMAEKAAVGGIEDVEVRFFLVSYVIIKFVLLY